MLGFLEQPQLGEQFWLIAEFPDTTTASKAILGHLPKLAVLFNFNSLQTLIFNQNRLLSH